MVSLIGGPQSSGTSLLRQIVNRHDTVVCLNESHMFCKKDFYHNWNKAKLKLSSRGAFGIKSEGWKLFSGLDYKNNPLLEKSSIRYLAKRTNSFQEFINAVYAEISSNSETLFMDKTPANVFCFPDFLDHFSSSKVIACIRNPYDIIASLVSRRISVLDAVCLVKSAFSTIMGLIDEKRMYIVKYEELVSKPIEIVKDVCSFLGLVFSEKLLITNKEQSDSITKLEGWNYDEARAIEQGSVGRFSQIHEELQENIKYAIINVKWGNDDALFQSLCSRMDYALYPLPTLKNYKKELKKQKTRSLIEKMSYLHPYTIMSNPVTII